MRDVAFASLLLCAITCPRCERPTEVRLQVTTDSPVDLTISCPHAHAVDKLGKTPYGPFHAHIGDTLLFTDDDAGFYYAESVTAGTPGGPPEQLDREFNLKR